MSSVQPVYVKLADVQERAHLAIEHRRKYPNRDGNRGYDDGYEDALGDLLDALAGWCHPSVNIKHWVDE